MNSTDESFFQLALVTEVDVNGLVGIGVHQFAVNDLEFDGVDGRAAAPAAAGDGCSGGVGRCGRRGGLGGWDDCPIDVGITTAFAAEVEPPGAVSVDDDVAVVADEHAVLRLPMRAILRPPDALPRPGVGNQPILALPMNALGPFAVAVRSE